MGQINFSIGSTQFHHLHLLKDDTLGHAGATEGVSLHGRHGVCLVVVLGMPLGVSVLNSKLATGSDTTWLSLTHVCFC